MREKRNAGRETNLGEVWKVALSLFAFGAELAMCQRCGGRTAEKDGGDGKEDADGWRRLHKGEGSQKEKTGLK